MKFFSNICAKRNVILMVLMAWAFALASGVVNACLLEARETNSYTVTVESSEAAHESVMFPGHPEAVADGVGESHSKAPCLKVCDDGSRSFPKQDLTVAQNDPGPALLVGILWGTAAPVIPTLHHMDDEQPAKPVLPIRIRFSRLAI